MAHTLTGRSRAVRYADLNLVSEAATVARTELAACFQLAALHGLEEGTCSHFLAMVPGRDDLFFVNPYGYAFAEVRAENLLVCDFQAMWWRAKGSQRRRRSTFTPGCTNNCRG